MASFSENGVQVEVRLRRADGDRVLVSTQTTALIDGQDRPIRSSVDEDLTAVVPPDLAPHVTALLDAAEAYARAVYGIA